MRHAAGEPRQHVLMKDRHGQRDMIQVRAGDVGIVGDEDVARRDLVEAEMRDLASTVSAMPRMNIGRPRPIDTVSPFAVKARR